MTNKKNLLFKLHLYMNVTYETSKISIVSSNTVLSANFSKRLDWNENDYIIEPNFLQVVRKVEVAINAVQKLNY